MNGSIFESPKPRNTCLNKLEASNLFLQGMWCDMVDVTNLMYEMIYFVSYWHTDRSHMVVLLFMACVLYIISMWYVVILMDNQDGGAMDLGATPVGWWRSYHDAQDGDQVQEGPYHIILSMHVMLILLCILFCLDRNGSIIRWSLSINIKIIMCSSLVCTVKKVHRFETPRDDRVW